MKYDFAYKQKGYLWWIVVDASTEYEAIKEARRRMKREPYAGPCHITEKAR